MCNQGKNHPRIALGSSVLLKILDGEVSRLKKMYVMHHRRSIKVDKL